MKEQKRAAAEVRADRRPAWTMPRVECLQTRPEVTAYAGDADPWTGRQR